MAAHMITSLLLSRDRCVYVHVRTAWRETFVGKKLLRVPLFGGSRKYSPRNLGAWCLLAWQKRAICESFLRVKILLFTNLRKFSPTRKFPTTVLASNLLTYIL